MNDIPGIKRIVVKQYPKLTSWSFSRWSTYNECPLRARYQYIDKLPSPESGPMLRGTQIHKLAEDYLLNPKLPLPDQLSKLAAHYQMLRKKKPGVEVELALDPQWNTTDWKGGWCRMKLDVVVPPDKTFNVDIQDHKTGGVDKLGRLKDGADEKYAPQLELYGIAGFILYPEAATTSTSLNFTDAGVVVPGKKFKRDELPKLKTNWELRIDRMMRDTIYAAKPGFWCNYCHYRKSNGGPCAY